MDLAFPKERESKSLVRQPRETVSLPLGFSRGPTSGRRGGGRGKMVVFRELRWLALELLKKDDGASNFRLNHWSRGDASVRYREICVSA